MGTAEINGEVMNEFLDHTCIKKLSDNTENIFETKIKNYVSQLEGVYNP